jgi:tripartite-type tricarboxylate transporter receptor subunit TctC
MMSWIGNATSQALIPQQEFDINRDFVHVSQLLSGANVLVVHPSSGFRTLADLIRHAKAHPGQLSYASAGNGSSGHLAMEMLKQRAGVSMLHIPYRGGGPALMDLMSGRVQLMFNNQDVVLGPIQAGKLWPLAVSTPVRNPLYPQLPTVAESGFAGFEATAWAGVSGPKGLPPAVVDTLHSAIAKALQGPLRQKYESVGAQVVASTPEQFSQFVRRETEGWSAVIKKGGIRLD